MRSLKELFVQKRTFFFKKTVDSSRYQSLIKKIIENQKDALNVSHVFSLFCEQSMNCFFIRLHIEHLMFILKKEQKKIKILKQSLK